MLLVSITYELVQGQFDRATKGNLAKATIGGIIRNEHGKGIVAFTGPIGIQTNHCVEAIAAHQTIELDKEMGVKLLQLEGDSKSIIDYLNGRNRPTWTTTNIIGECIQDLQTFDNTYMAHKYYVVNMVVDKLANWGVKHNVISKWTDGFDIPLEVNEVIEKDCIPSRLGIIKLHNEIQFFVG